MHFYFALTLICIWLLVSFWFWLFVCLPKFKTFCRVYSEIQNSPLLLIVRIYFRSPGCYQSPTGSKLTKLPWPREAAGITDAYKYGSSYQVHSLTSISSRFSSSSLLQQLMSDHDEWDWESAATEQDEPQREGKPVLHAEWPVLKRRHACA